MNKIILGTAVLSLTATAAISQGGERSLLDAGKFWTAGGSEQTSKTIKDAAVPGSRAIEITSSGKNSNTRRMSPTAWSAPISRVR